MENSLLVVAKMEYTNQLQELLSKHIHEGICTLWKSIGKSETGVLKKFQENLCSIPLWNQEVIDKEYQKIVKNISKDYLDKVIEAVFLSNVKILSVVKLNNNSKRIDVNVPDTKHFLHKCYIETAREFYRDPYLIEDRNTHISASDFHKNYNKRFEIINSCIEKTIRNSIPMEDILNKYLSSEESDLNLHQNNQFIDDLDEEEPEEHEPEENGPEDFEQQLQENHEDPAGQLFMQPPSVNPDLQPVPEYSVPGSQQPGVSIQQPGSQQQPVVSIQQPGSQQPQQPVQETADESGFFTDDE